MSAAGIEAFRSYLPVRISFGDGVSGELAGILDGLGATSALVLLEEPVVGIPGVAAALAACEERGITLHRHMKPPGEPTFAAAEDVATEIALLDPGRVRRDRRWLGARSRQGGAARLRAGWTARALCRRRDPDRRAAPAARDGPDHVGHGLGRLGRRRHDGQGDRAQGRAGVAEHASAVRARRPAA